MLAYMIRDYKQLTNDMETLSDSLQPVMVKLQIEEESNSKAKKDYNCESCKFNDNVDIAYPCDRCIVKDDSGIPFDKPSHWTPKEE